jgi:hypothetical protein
MLPNPASNKRTRNSRLAVFMVSPLLHIDLQDDGYVSWRNA